MDIIAYNQQAWDGLVRKGDRWTLPYGDEEIELARQGKLNLVLTPKIPVPMSWYPPLKGLNVLALASGGGQQVPALAAAGAIVTVYDLSAEQLRQDIETCNKYDLKITAIQGNMMDMSSLPSAAFDLIFHPCSNCFAPDLKPVWASCARVLKKGGVLMWGFTKAENMLLFKDPQTNIYTLKYKMPYSDISSLTEEERSVYTKENEPLIFGHSLEDQIGELLKNNFHLTDIFEDDWGGAEPVDQYFKSFVAARAVKV
ncbi:MAG: class I SAM-dependent methyltransferase [Bacteroidetes bacterium]|nr:class I SAM-dependent methyltransferase [Bacteroidota bacterium]